jgi:hypothetical protein
MVTSPVQTSMPVTSPGNARPSRLMMTAVFNGRGEAEVVADPAAVAEQDVQGSFLNVRDDRTPPLVTCLDVVALDENPPDPVLLNCDSQRHLVRFARQVVIRWVPEFADGFLPGGSTTTAAIAHATATGPPAPYLRAAADLLGRRHALASAFRELSGFPGVAGQPPFLITSS